MTKTNETKAQPAYRIYSVVESEGEKAVWHELGAAWPHKDGKGFNLQLKALPLPDAQMVLRAPLPPQNDKPATTKTRGKYAALKQSELPVSE